MLKERIEKFGERTEFVLVLAISFIYFIGTSLSVLLRHVRTLELTTARALWGIAIEVAILFLIGVMLRVRGWNVTRLTERFSLASALAGLPLFGAYMMSYWTASWIALSIDPSVSRMSTMRMVVTASPVVVGVLIVVNSVFEEALVTGYVITVLSPQGAALAITASTLIRLLYHLYQGPIATLSILPLGLLFGAVYWRWRTLWPLMVAHSIANAIAFACAP